jgi:F0F1-type ATP synthase membrane subunit c/vacuolar-type H+-ATPase subunit K
MDAAKRVGFGQRIIAGRFEQAISRNDALRRKMFTAISRAPGDA